MTITGWRVAGWGGLVALIFCAATAEADDPPAPSPTALEMLRSMREKGILSDDEYQDLYRRQAVYELEQREASRLPGWLRDWTFGGDLRVRWERIARDSIRADRAQENGVAIDARNGRAVGTQERGRMRLRLGAERRVGDNFVVGFRIGTAAGTSYGDLVPPVSAVADREDFGQTVLADPRSQNTTFGDYFAPKQVFVDRAYLRFAPTAAPSFRLTVGKVPNPYISNEFPADFLVWDHDLQLEGGTLEYAFDLYPERARLEIAGGYAFLDEIGSIQITGGEDNAQLDDPDTTPVGPDFDDADPYMYGMQAGLIFSPNSWLRFGGRASYYDLRDLGTRFAAAAIDLGNGGGAFENFPLARDGSLFADPRSRGRMREMVYDAFAGVSGGGWGLVAFAQTTQLLGVTGGEDRGYALGLHLDTPIGTRVTFLYGRVERNGTIALFTDSDLFDGYTNVKGYYVAVQHPLTQHIRLRAAFFSSELLNESCNAAEIGLEVFYCDSTEGAIGDFKNFRKDLLDRNRLQVDLQVAF